MISAITGEYYPGWPFCNVVRISMPIETYGEACFYLGIGQYLCLILRTPTSLRE